MTIESGTSTVVVHRARIVRVGDTVGPGRAGLMRRAAHPPARLPGAPGGLGAGRRGRRTRCGGWWTTCSRRWTPPRASAWPPTRSGVALRVAVVDAEGDALRDDQPASSSRPPARRPHGGGLPLAFPRSTREVTRPERIVLEAIGRDGPALPHGGERARGPRHPARDRPPRRHPLPRPPEPDEAAAARREVPPRAQGRRRATSGRSRGPPAGRPDAHRLLRDPGVRGALARRAPPWRARSVGRGDPAGPAPRPLPLRRWCRRPSRTRPSPPGSKSCSPNARVGDLFAATLRHTGARPRRRGRRTGTSSGPRSSRSPPRGMINVHASLLPALARRRADPGRHPARRSSHRRQHHADGGGARQRAGVLSGASCPSAPRTPRAR